MSHRPLTTNIALLEQGAELLARIDDDHRWRDRSIEPRSSASMHAIRTIAWA